MRKYHKIFLAAFLITALSTAIQAAPLKQVQIFLPGNFNGKLATIHENLNITQTNASLFPNTINSFKSAKLDSFVFCTGNIANIFEPISYLSKGDYVIELLSRCSLDASAISPLDLESLDLRRHKPYVYNCLLTNAAAGNYANPFQSHILLEKASRRFYFMNFVSNHRSSLLALDSWNDFKLEPFDFSLRKHAFEFKSSDITISVAYGSVSDVESLKAYFANKSGLHFILHRPDVGEVSPYAAYNLDFEGNVCVFKANDSGDRLPILNIIFKNHGLPRIQLRNLPVKADNKPQKDQYFEQFSSNLKERLIEPLYMIKTDYMPSTAIKKFCPWGLTKIIKSGINADVVILLEPKQSYFSDNVVRLGTILQNVSNDRVFLMRLSGLVLGQLAAELHRNRSWIKTFYTGCSFHTYLDNIYNFKVDNTAIKANETYLLAITEKSLENIVIKAIFEKEKYEIIEKHYLWDFCIKYLKGSEVQPETLFYKGL